jgi:hypothetical protein
MHKSEIDKMRLKFPDQDLLQATLDDSTEGNAIQRVADVAQIDTKKAAELLGVSLRQTADSLVRSWLSRHWADLILFVGIIFLALLPKLGELADTWAAAVDGADKLQVVAIRDLPPYAPLESSDFKATNMESPDDTSRFVARLVGRYPMRLIKEGETIVSDSLSTSKLHLKDFSVLHVNLKLKPAVEISSFPSRTDLLLSGRDVPQSGAIFSIHLLNLEGDGLTATVAIPNASVHEVAARLGSSEAYLIFPVT